MSILDENKELMAEAAKIDLCLRRIEKLTNLRTALFVLERFAIQRLPNVPGPHIDEVEWAFETWGQDRRGE